MSKLEPQQGSIRTSMSRLELYIQLAKLVGGLIIIGLLAIIAGIL